MPAASNPANGVLLDAQALKDAIAAMPASPQAALKEALEPLVAKADYYENRRGYDRKADGFTVAVSLGTCRRVRAAIAAMPASPQAALMREALEEARGLLSRYRNETPLGHQPHMIVHFADKALAKIDAALQPNGVGQ